MSRRRPRDDDDDDYPDDDYGDDTVTTMHDAARVAAAVRGSRHSNDYEQYIATKYPSVPKTGADIKPGDTYIRIDPLAKKETRENAPRADGFDPKKPRERRYGPTWRANYDERHEILQRHPYYRSLDLIAGYANQPINRLIVVDSMIARQAGERARQRTTELQAKIAENKIEELQRRLRELKTLESEQLQGLGRVAVLERTAARKEKLEEQQELGQAQLESVQKLISKYERLQRIFNAWMSEVFNSVPPEQRDAANERFMNLLDVRFATPDLELLQDFIFGVELSGAAHLRDSIEAKLNFLDRRKDPSGSGGSSLSGAERMVQGDEIGFVAQEWMRATQEASGLIDLANFLNNRDRLPKFSSVLIKTLLEPSTIDTQIDEVNEKLGDLSMMTTELPFDPRELEKRRDFLLAELARLQKRKEELEKTPLSVSALTIDQLRLAEQFLREYSALPLQKVGPQRFFEAYGAEFEIGGSTLLLRALELSRQKLFSLTSQVKERQVALDAIEKEIVMIEERTRTISAIEDMIAKATAEVDAAIRELNELGVSQYSDTFAHQNQPWISGILDIESRVTAALSQTLAIVRESTGNPELTLHQLMSEEQWLNPFAMLAGAILERNGMSSGSSYAQLDILQRKDLEIEAIKRRYFAPQGGLSSLYDRLDQSRADRAAIAMGSTGDSVEVELMRQSYGRRMQGINPVSALNPAVPAIREWLSSRQRK